MKLSYKETVERDLILDSIKSWNRYDREAWSHEGLTREYNSKLKLASAAWNRVLRHVRNASNTAIEAAARETTYVHDAVRHIRINNRTA